MNFKPYSDLEETGDLALPLLPRHWGRRDLKYLAQFVNGAPFKPADWTEQGTPIIRIENLNGGAEFNRINFAVGKKYEVREGDLLFGWSGNRGTSFGPFIWNRPGSYYLNQHIFRVTDYKLEKRYLYWALKAVTVTVESQVSGIIGLVHITKPELGNVQIPLPPPADQRMIADFLDRATSQIDELISKKRSMIELLREKRTAYIARAVTQGLNTSAPMKSSGIETVGQVPVGWDIQRAKVVFREIDERLGNGSDELLSVSHITGVTPRSEKPDVNMFMAESLEAYKRCKRNDLVINTMWAWMGALAITEYEGVVSPSYNVYRFKRDLVPKYIDCLFRTPQYITEITRRSKGVWSSRLRLYPDEFFQIPTLLPPLAEQAQIVLAIDTETGQYEKAIDALDQSCNRLAEYRAALITAAVTGKIALEPAEKPTQTRKANPYFKRAVLAAEIVHQLHNDSNLGRTKLQKLLFLCEHHAQLPDLESHYLRQAAGPYDSQMMHSVESQIERQRWYRCEARSSGEYHYLPLESAGEHTKYFVRYWADKTEAIHNIVRLLKKADTRQCEIVATLYGAWNDLILAGNSVNDELILNEILNQWHEKKRQIPVNRWRDAIAWMRQQGLVPTGFGKPTRQKST